MDIWLSVGENLGEKADIRFDKALRQTATG
jgi:hypothetical protein